MSPAQEAVKWLAEIERTAGHVSPATAAELRRAAEYGFRTYVQYWGPAWGQFAARQHAKGVLAGTAASTDPQVEAALRIYRKASDRAGRLLEAGTGTGDTAGLDTTGGPAAGTTGHEAGQMYENYLAAWAEAAKRHSAEVNQAWREADVGFIAAHRTELQAAWPAGFAQISAQFPAGRQEMPGLPILAPPAATRPYPRDPACVQLAGLDFPGTSAGRPGGSSGQRSRRAGITLRAGRPRPGRLR